MKEMRKLVNSFKKRETASPYHFGKTVDLVERYRISENLAFDGVPTVYYNILLHGSDLVVGKCDLRLKSDARMYYYGAIGYNVIQQYRGHHYAYHACRILFTIAREEFGMKELLITCDPDNIASYKTLKALKGELIDVAKIPESHELYRQGERYKCVFRYIL